jgi:hypothetical protein
MYAYEHVDEKGFGGKWEMFDPAKERQKINFAQIL